MADFRSPSEVFRALVDGVAAGRWAELPGLYAESTHVVHPFDPLRAAALTSRDQLREHFRPVAGGPEVHRRAVGIKIHETTDPEVIVAEFDYVGTIDGRPFTQPGIFVLRVRDGEIVSSRDYFDHFTAYRDRGLLGELVGQLAEERAQVGEDELDAVAQAAGDVGGLSGVGADVEDEQDEQDPADGLLHQTGSSRRGVSSS
jgi:ketosteroid isomerase-like protein